VNELRASERTALAIILMASTTSALNTSHSAKMLPDLFAFVIVCAIAFWVIVGPYLNRASRNG
jgi:hypothetical protein